MCETTLGTRDCCHCSGLSSNPVLGCPFAARTKSECARAWAARGVIAVMPPPKQHFFNLRSPPGTSVDEVIDAVEGLVTVNEIYSVQHLGAFDFQVGINSASAVQHLLEVGGLRLGNQVVPLVPVARQVASVTCMYLPSYISDNEVATSLKTFGTTLRIEEARYKDRPSIRTGTRYLKMEMKQDNPLPNFARVSGHRATFEYRGVRRLCRRCSLEGHYKAQCQTPFCRRCGIYGHPEETCSLACRRCGGAHASVDCTARKSYSMAAMEVDDFPPLGRATETEKSRRRMTPLTAASRTQQRDRNSREEPRPAIQAPTQSVETQGPQENHPRSQDNAGTKTPSPHGDERLGGEAVAAQDGGQSNQEGAQHGDDGTTPHRQGELRQDPELTPGLRGTQTSQHKEQQPPAPHGIPQGGPNRGDEHGARRSSESSTEGKNQWEVEASSSTSDESSTLVIDEAAPQSPRHKNSEDTSKRGIRSQITNKDGSQAQRPGTTSHGDSSPLLDTEGGGTERAHGSAKKPRRDDSAERQTVWSVGTLWEDLTPGQRGSVPGTVDPMDADDSDFY
ncbi:hypothetical protein HPB49_000571 [Dermacentor silvarum]|uniref:Uncharacterized protein n=1 Tax=Dermacentor silvarum TaxID=543639 RepID=A0ACB8D1G9_DERSI|nr:hypothetical protein HPB49_000571 [Dermacentor silvarum]